MNTLVLQGTTHAALCRKRIYVAMALVLFVVLYPLTSRTSLPPFNAVVGFLEP